MFFRQYSTRCDLLAAVKNGQVDLFYGHLPDLYYIRENQLSYEPLLSVVSAPSSANVGAQTYDVGIVSYDPKIQSIYDLKNQVFAVSSPLSVSGSILPRYLLKAYGIGFRPLEAGSSEEAMKAVLKDKAKAASTWWPSTGAAPSKGRLLLLIHDVPNPVIIAKKGLSRHSLEGYTLIAKLMSMPDLTPDHNHHIFFTSCFIFHPKKLSYFFKYGTKYLGIEDIIKSFHYIDSGLGATVILFKSVVHKFIIIDDLYNHQTCF